MEHLQDAKDRKIADIKGRTIKGFFWTGSGKFFEQGLRWIISIFLARLLSPSDYGLMALTSLFIYYLNYFNELSIGDTIIQKNDLNEKQLSSAFWFTLAMSFLTYSLLYLVSSKIAIFFNQEKLTQILKIAGLSFIIISIGVVPSSLISKQLNFRLLAKVNIISNFLMGISSLFLAIQGLGVWSLVLGSMIKHLSFSILIFFFCTWRPRFLFSFKSIKYLFKFGLSLTASKSLHTLYYNSDNLIVGKFLGEKALGYYYMAFNLSTMLIDRLSRVINEVNFPILSVLQDSNDKAKNHFLKTARYISIVIIPLLFGMALVADDFVNVVLGEKWIPIIFPLKLFCLVGVLRSINSTIPSLLISKGRTDLNFKYSLSAGILLPIGFLIGATFGLNGVVYAWIIIYPLLTAYLLRLGLREIGLSFKEYRKNLSPAIKASIFMSTAVILFQLITIDNKILRLVGSILTGILSYTTFINIMHKEILLEARNIFHILRVKKSEG
jgi:O-antigen/teichoic acid export membrane protein